MKTVRRIYIVLIICLVIITAGALLKFRKENNNYKAEKAALQKVWDDHNKKVQEREMSK